MVKKIIFILLVTLILIGCYRDQPSLHDNEFSVKLYVKYKNHLIKNAEVKLASMDYEQETIINTTDSTGSVIFKNLPFTDYNVSIKDLIEVPSSNMRGPLDTIMIQGGKIISPADEEFLIDTIYTFTSGIEPGIKINEIYYCGPPNDFFYQYDQFIELYNSSDDTLYLDGMVICRVGQQGLESISSIFQFPGKPEGITKQYPILPDSFIVIAQDALDHREYYFEGQASVDLSNADFECVNYMDYNDYDNPNVPNLDNLTAGWTHDFIISTRVDGIIIADGSDLNYQDGININSILDGVDYGTDKKTHKELEDVVDVGLGGLGMIQYSGKSLERITPGFDTNNSTVDFKIISLPTPGYQHE